jgi:hypothetical protein
MEADYRRAAYVHHMYDHAGRGRKARAHHARAVDHRAHFGGDDRATRTARTASRVSVWASGCSRLTTTLPSNPGVPKTSERAIAGSAPLLMSA